ncbi:MAG: HAD-IIIC family phosphatase [Magnetococcus sp. DMHC-1]
MDMHAVTTLILADFTIDPLADRLNNRPGLPGFQARVGPFDQVMPLLLDAQHPVWQPQPDLLILWTRPERAVPEYGRFRDGLEIGEQAVLDGVNRFADLIRQAAGRAGMIFLPSWVRPPFERGLGVLDMRPGLGIGQLVYQMNLHLSRALQDVANVRILDTQRWQLQVGHNGFNPKLWYMGKMAFTPAIHDVASAEIAAGLLAQAGLSRKIILLDLDDTLWGGIVGEVGWEHLNLGGHQAAGESFVDFQRALKRLKNRGILLGILSRNDESVAMEALTRHPEMILRPDDFVGWRINWSDKASNLASLLEEVNLLPPAAVFIDDQPAERARVREAFPEVLVPDWPRDKLLYVQALESLACFDPAQLTDEDLHRTESYVAERKRQETRQTVTSMTEWLAALELRIQVERVQPVNLARSAQLLNKTNQMNLRTRRLLEPDFMQWASDPGHACFVFRVMDRFGDYGLTGIASLALARQDNRSVAQVVDFVLSCRVMGRGVEKTMLHVLVQEALDLGAELLEAIPLPTAKNGPCRKYFQTESGLHAQPAEAQDRYTWDTRNPYPLPEHVTLEQN